MAHLDTAFKLGALSAVDDFTAWLQNDDGNPTEYPKRRGAILKTAQPNPMQPNLGASMGVTNNVNTASSTGAINRTGGTGGGVAGAAPAAPSSGTSGTGFKGAAADQAVEKVMRKLGKSMSRRPLGREGTKFEALKKKLRKQKSKKR